MDPFCIVFCLLLQFFVCQARQEFDDGPLVDTDYGTVRGSRKTDEQGRLYEEYLGIPFASPPGRWERPVPPEPWEGVLDATEFGPHCTQFVAAFYPLMGMSNETSEDCLTINIWVPEAASRRNLPVMVYYYGGAYILGTGAMYPGYGLALHGDVIVVNFNYRVSTLGWLTTADDVSPGNYGLWDAKAALEWVQGNIRHFGGDQNRVTIFGQSAGGAMVSQSLISPRMHGLFERGIPISGAASGFVGRVFANSSRASAQMLGRLFFCMAGENSQLLINCLKQQEAGALDFWGVVGVVVFRQQLPNFGPVLDFEFLSEDVEPFVAGDPSDLWREGAADQYDILIGNTYQDAAGFVLLNPIGFPLPNNTYGWARSAEALDFALGFIMNIYDNPNVTRDTMYEQYPDMLSDDDLTRTLATTEATTDWWFGSSLQFEAEHHSRTSQGRNTYFYNFHYDPSFLLYPEWVEGSHLDDLYSVFGETFLEIYRENILRTNFTDVDRKLSEDIMTYYTNFARTGDPNEGLDEVAVQWPQYDEDTRLYLSLSDNMETKAVTEEQLDKYEFWTEEWKTIAIPRDACGPRDDDCEEEEEPFWEEIEIELAIETVRDIFRDMLEDFPEILDDVEAKIDYYVDQRRLLVIKHMFGGDEDLD